MDAKGILEVGWPLRAVGLPRNLTQIPNFGWPTGVSSVTRQLGKDRNPSFPRWAGC